MTNTGRASLQRRERFAQPHLGLPHEAVHGLRDVGGVHGVVVRVVAVVVLLHHDQEPPEFDPVQLKELHQAVLVEQVEGQGDQAVS